MKSTALPGSRRAIEDMIERLIARLDEMDGDPDMEPGCDAEADAGEESQQPTTLAPVRVRLCTAARRRAA